MSEQKDKLLGHDYDGIKELDNDLPKWWINIFYITIVFSVVYFAYYHIWGDTRTLAETFDNEQAITASAPAHGGDFTDDTVNSMLTNADALAKGKTIFIEKCAACHGPMGGGLVGPNLTDKFWIHGGKPAQIAKVISEGVPEKGMISWKTMLSREDIIATAVYIKSLKGTNPPGAKPPQGNEEND